MGHVNMYMFHQTFSILYKTTVHCVSDRFMHSTRSYRKTIKFLIPEITTVIKSISAEVGLQANRMLLSSPLVNLVKSCVRDFFFIQTQVKF